MSAPTEPASVQPDLTNPASTLKSETVLPLHAETVIVTRRRVAKALVRVARTTHDREARVDEELVHERIEVEHVPIGRVVDAIPAVRVEGDTTIFPVVEEILVVERRLVLKEEVRLRRVTHTERHVETVMVREQIATVTRSPLPGSDDDSPADIKSQHREEMP